MSKPYFLTSNTVTLLEDCVREIETHAGLYLVHGSNGIGKTGLLEELTRNRLDGKVRWIDLQDGASGEDELCDSSDLIEKTFARANPGDIVVADHFEMALKKSRHQLFLSWSTDGIDKQLNLIIGSDSDSLAELRQLAQHYQVRMQIYPMQPFSDDEIEAFLGFYLYPHRDLEKLSVPPLLRNQLAAARGDVGQIIEIAERAGDQFVNAAVEENEPQPRRSLAALVAVPAVVVVLAFVGWYLLDSDRGFPVIDAVTGNEQLQEFAQTSQGVRPAALGESQSESRLIAVADVELPDETLVGSSSEAATLALDSDQSEAVEAFAESHSDDFDRDISDSGEPSGLVGGTDDAVLVDAGTDPASETEEPVQQASDMSVSITYYEDLTDDAPLQLSKQVDGYVVEEVSMASLSEPVPDKRRLRQDLDASMEWVAARDGATGTLQILLLSKARFDIEAYYQHVSGLEREGVDVSRLKIVETLTAGRETYSVLYGEYPSRLAAAEARGGLVAILRDAAPIARSVGGLRTEIRRLAGQN